MPLKGQFSTMEGYFHFLMLLDWARLNKLWEKPLSFLSSILICFLVAAALGKEFFCMDLQGQVHTYTCTTTTYMNFDLWNECRLCVLVTFLFVVSLWLWTDYFCINFHTFWQHIVIGKVKSVFFCSGKTRLAQAVSGEIEATFYCVSSSDLISSWVGESEK